MHIIMNYKVLCYVVSICYCWDRLAFINQGWYGDQRWKVWAWIRYILSFWLIGRCLYLSGRPLDVSSLDQHSWWGSPTGAILLISINSLLVKMLITDEHNQADVRLGWTYETNKMVRDNESEWGLYLCIALFIFDGVAALDSADEIGSNQAVCVLAWVSAIFYFWMRFILPNKGVAWSRGGGRETYAGHKPSILFFWIAPAVLRYMAGLWLVIKLIDVSGGYYSTCRAM